MVIYSQEETKENPITHIVLRNARDFKERHGILGFWVKRYPDKFTDDKVEVLTEYIQELEKEKKK